MRELIGSVSLRNPRDVYRDGSDYHVEEIGPRQTYISRIPSQAVTFLEEELAGLTVTADQASSALEPQADLFGLPYTYGHKLEHYARNVLCVMIARGTAQHRKVGRQYLFEVR